LAGKPDTPQSELGHFSALWYWLSCWGIHHWHPCSYCGNEGTEERCIRLLKIALSKRLIAFTENEQCLLDDHNVERVIAVLDEIEAPKSWAWWKEHYDQCPKRLELLEIIRQQQEEWATEQIATRTCPIENSSCSITSPEQGTSGSIVLCRGCDRFGLGASMLHFFSSGQSAS